MKEIFQEIFFIMRSNKLRTSLTGFAVSWGIFILMILLGFSNELRRMGEQNYSSTRQNTLTISGGRTSMVHNGLKKNRRIKVEAKDSVLFSTKFHPIVEGVTSVQDFNQMMKLGKKEVTTSLACVTPDYIDFANINVLYGRFINKIDIEERRKVLVMNKEVAKLFFGSEEAALGKEVELSKLKYTIVGVSSEKWNNKWSNNYMPITTRNVIYSQSRTYDNLTLMLGDVANLEEAEDIELVVRNRAANIYNFNPEDKRGVWIRNNFKQYFESRSMGMGIYIFTWIIGLGTLLIGVVGVSNIMLISVKERTREFGIRKALGAKPRSILFLVIIEGITITTIFGYIGIIMGAGLLELISLAMTSGGEKSASDFGAMGIQIDLNIVYLATTLLVISGVIAGLIPALKAVRIKPIDAMRG